MNIQSRMNRMRSNGSAAKFGKQPYAFADPLERAEWEGLRWSIPIIARMVSGPRAETKNDRKINQVERFTAPVGAQAVCVS